MGEGGLQVRQISKLLPPLPPIVFITPTLLFPTRPAPGTRWNIATAAESLLTASNKSRAEYNQLD